MQHRIISGQRLAFLLFVFSSFLCVCTFAHSLNEIRDRSLNGTTNGQQKVPFLIGIAGGSASGKTTACKRLEERLGQADMEHHRRQIVCISQDNFFRELNASEKAIADKGLFNFDHPSALDSVRFYQTLKDISAGKDVAIPIYDFKNSSSGGNHIIIEPADVVLFEGTLVLYFPEIRNLFNMKFFFDTDSGIRLARKLLRDMTERGRDFDNILYQYLTFGKPGFEEFCLPTKTFADVIIPRGAENTVAIDLIAHYIRDTILNSAE